MLVGVELVYIEFVNGGEYSSACGLRPGWGAVVPWFASDVEVPADGGVLSLPNDLLDTC